MTSPSNKVRYSFSKLSAYHQCVYQYYLLYFVDIYQCKDCGVLHYVKKHTAAPQCCSNCGCKTLTHLKKENNAFAEYGGFVHELLEKYALNELLESELLDEYEDMYDVYVQHEFPPNNYVDLAESYYNSGYQYLADFEGFDYLVDSYKVLGVEEHFVLDFGGFELQGFIDLILEDTNGDIVLVDHKSKKEFKSKAEQKKYARQLYLYSTYIIEKYGKTPKTLIFNHFRKKKCVIPFNQKDYDEAIKWMRDTVEAIESNEDWISNFTVDDFYCSNLCDWRNVCKYK